MYNRNALLAFLMQGQPPVNMLADASQDFDPNSIVGKMIARQRALEAAKAAQQMQQNPPQAGYQQPPIPSESATDTLRRRMREQGLDQ